MSEKELSHANRATLEAADAALVAHFKSIQPEPGTIFVGFAVNTTLDREWRDGYAREIGRNNTRHRIVVLEMVPHVLGPTDILLCEPDNEDPPRIEYYRTVPKPTEGG
jgi:hypothetical protein